MVIFSHPTGNANVRAAALGLLEKNILSSFHTSISTFPGDFLYRVGGLGPLAELRRRSFDIELRGKTTMTPWKELGRIASLKSGLRKFVEHEKG
ncbi:MAG: glycosyl transferase family 1, partial [Ginsengibacter sp.]